MLLLITGSCDGTGDLLISKIGANAFRFNYDLYKQYDFEFRPDYWEIKNPVGHSINSRNVTCAFWWKAFNFPLEGEDDFIVEEVKYVFRELYNWCRLRGITRGNPYDFHNRLGKINLLNIAAKHFRVPETLATFRLAGLERLQSTNLVAKSFSSALTKSKATLMTTTVRKDALHPDFPWYLQETITSDADITVFICGGATFAYERDRRSLKGLDWRLEQDSDPNAKEWISFPLCEKMAAAVKNFCADIEVDWGRLDLMKQGKEFSFLEFNANGQWVFLDYSGEGGLLDAVVAYLTENAGV